MIYRRLVEVDWRVPLGLHDAMQSYLVEHPGSYYIGGSRQWLFYLTRDHGLLQFNHDFSEMSNLEISEHIEEALELLDHDSQEN